MPFVLWELTRKSRKQDWRGQLGEEAKGRAGKCRDSECLVNVLGACSVAVVGR